MIDPKIPICVHVPEIIDSTVLNIFCFEWCSYENSKFLASIITNHSIYEITGSIVTERGICVFIYSSFSKLQMSDVRRAVCVGFKNSICCTFSLATVHIFTENQRKKNKRIF